MFNSYYVDLEIFQNFTIIMQMFSSKKYFIIKM